VLSPQEYARLDAEDTYYYQYTRVEVYHETRPFLRVFYVRKLGESEIRLA
jgi:hypothetical protein